MVNVNGTIARSGLLILELAHLFCARQMKMRCLWLRLCLTPFVLGLSITALFTAAPAQAVSVAQAPNSPAEQPDLAVPATPVPNPPASEQPAASAITLTLQDLPDGFQEVPPQIKQQIATRLEPFKQVLAKGNLPLSNFFAFANLEKFEVVFGFTTMLPDQPLALATFDTALQQLQQTAARQQLISKIRESLQFIQVIELIDYSELPELNNLANASTGLTLAGKLQGRPVRIDVASFRRNGVGAFTAVFHADGTKPVITVKDVASKLDNRILQFSPSASMSRLATSPSEKL